MTAITLTEERAPGAAATLASAFGDDPLWSWLFRNDGDNADRLGPMFNALCAHEARVGGEFAFVSDAGDAVAVWKGIDEWRLPPTQMLRMIPAMIRTFRGRLPAGLSMLAAVEKAHPTAPHYYLEFLGVRADRQGKGLGGEMLVPMLERCDREGVPAYLENSNPKNTPFYARHGFVPSGTIDLPAGAPELLPMWREPR